MADLSALHALIDAREQQRAQDVATMDELLVQIALQIPEMVSPYLQEYERRKVINLLQKVVNCLITFSRHEAHQHEAVMAARRQKLGYFVQFCETLQRDRPDLAHQLGLPPQERGDGQA